MNKLNTRLNELYTLVNELMDMCPKEDCLTDDWNDVFNDIQNLKTSLNMVTTDDNSLEKLSEVEIVFEAVKTAETNIEMFYENLNNYRNLMVKNTTSVYSDFDDNTVRIYIDGIWIGDMDKCIRLTHHAEDLYENTGFEYVHVEVCINGEWYGK